MWNNDKWNRFELKPLSRTSEESILEVKKIEKR